jgi:hypothetical protein
MSPRKTILRELSRAQTESGASYTRPSAISGYSESPEKFQKAVNELLRARLLEGRKDDDGRMAISLNDNRAAEIHRELRPLWARPAVWAAIATVVALGAGLAI